MINLSIPSPEEKKNYCALYLARHGETDWNAKGLLQGQIDGVPLNKTGRKQAVELAKKLKNIYFAKIFSSDLLRAKQTAEIVALQKEIVVEATKILRERYFGQFEGRAWQEDKEYQKLISEYQKLSEQERFRKSPHQSIESDEQLMGRLIPFLRQIAVAYPGKNILMITHGGLMRSFLVHIGYATYLTLPPGSINNTAYIKVLSDGIDFFIEQTYGIDKLS